MPFLYIKNRTNRCLVFNSVAGLVLEGEAKTVAVNTSDVDTLRPKLVAMSEQGLIDFNVYNSPDPADDDAEYVTLADIRALIAAAFTGSASRGIYIYKPGAAITFPTTIVFSSWAALYAQYVADGSGGFILVDDSIVSPAIIPAGTYDLSDAWFLGATGQQPTLLIDDGVVFSKPVFRAKDLVVQYDGTTDLMTVAADDGYLSLIYSTLQVLNTGNFFAKGVGATGESEIRLSESSSILPPISTGFPISVSAGELITVHVTTCSSIAANTIKGAGSVDVHYDASSTVSTTQPSLTGTLTLLPCDLASGVFYDDTLVAPLLGVDNVQDAIDALKGGATVAITRYDAAVIANVAANANVTGVGGGANLDAALGNYSAVSFVSAVWIYVNGVLQRNGANAAANHDVYPGDVPVNGDLKFEEKLKTGDQITMFIKA